VINNGSEVWRKAGELHARNVIDGQLIERLCDHVFQLDKQIEFWAHTVEGRILKANFPQRFGDVQWLQFAFKSQDNALLQHIWQSVEAWNVFEISNSNEVNIEFNAFGINKASGVREIGKLLGIEMSEVIAMGDSFNDISMIRAAGLGVAMGNAQQAVKEAADEIAPRNDEDGVAAIIEKYLLGRSHN
jgi:HAD superfamily hydrolase (TIGR01484 family)